MELETDIQFHIYLDKIGDLKLVNFKGLHFDKPNIKKNRISYI